MKHTILVVLLTLGVIGGLAAGIHRSRHHHHHGHFQARVADICVKAAERHIEKSRSEPNEQQEQTSAGDSRE